MKNKKLYLVAGMFFFLGFVCQPIMNFQRSNDGEFDGAMSVFGCRGAYSEGKLVSVVLSNGVMSDSLVNILCENKTINQIGFYNSKINLDDFKTIFNSVSLELVSFPGSELNDSYIKCLLNQRKLRHVDICNNSITIEGISDLLRLPNLENIVATGIDFKIIDLQRIADERSDIGVLTDIGVVRNGNVSIFDGG